MDFSDYHVIQVQDAWEHVEDHDHQDDHDSEGVHLEMREVLWMLETRSPTCWKFSLHLFFTLITLVPLITNNLQMNNKYASDSRTPKKIVERRK